MTDSYNERLQESARYHERLKATAQARHNAVRRVISAHQEEYDAIHEEERSKRGLPPKSVAGELAFLRRRVAELEAEHKR